MAIKGYKFIKNAVCAAVLCLLVENTAFKDVFAEREEKGMECTKSVPVIIEDIIPQGSAVRPGVKVDKKKYIVIHNTGNPNPTATARAHAAYLHSLTEEPVRQVSWHYTVDDKEIYHHVPDDENAWHASDGSYGEGNFYGIGIEVCVNGFPNKYEGAEYLAWTETFKQTLRNTAYLTARLMKTHGIGMDGVMQHYDFARDKKNCPMQMRYTSASGTFTRDNGDMWRYFLREVEKEYNKTEADQ